MKLISIFLILFFFGCSGYHFKHYDNPFTNYDIRSVTVPMFLNKSVIPNVSAPFTKEISLLLSSYSGLRVFSGEKKDTDAVLIGIITSADRMADVFRSSETFTSGDLERSIGERNSFYVPTTTYFKLKLRLVLIKRPSPEDLKLLESEIAPYINRHPRVVFNEEFDLEGSFTREVADNLSVDHGGSVNFTKNKAFMERAIWDLAKSTASNFQQVVLNAL